MQPSIGSEDSVYDTVLMDRRLQLTSISLSDAIKVKRMKLVRVMLPPQVFRCLIEPWFLNMMQDDHVRGDHFRSLSGIHRRQYPERATIMFS